jgi:hypothetical protein
MCLAPSVEVREVFDGLAVLLCPFPFGGSCQERTLARQEKDDAPFRLRASLM